MAESNLYCQFHPCDYFQFSTTSWSVFALGGLLSFMYSRTFMYFSEVWLLARRPGVIWTEGFVLPTLQTLCHGLCGYS